MLHTVMPVLSFVPKSAQRHYSLVGLLHFSCRFVHQPICELLIHCAC